MDIRYSSSQILSRGFLVRFKLEPGIALSQKLYGTSKYCSPFSWWSCSYGSVSTHSVHWLPCVRRKRARFFVLCRRRSSQRAHTYNNVTWLELDCVYVCVRSVPELASFHTVSTVRTLRDAKSVGNTFETTRRVCVLVRGRCRTLGKLRRRPHALCLQVLTSVCQLFTITL